jgi:hypothetical protein
MTGKIIRSIVTHKDSDHFHKLLKLQNKSIHELNHHISIENSKLSWIPRLKTEFVIVDYPTLKDQNTIDIDLLQVLENRGDIFHVSTMGPPKTPDIRVLLDCWNTCNDSQLREDQIRFYLEESLSQDFYLEDINSLVTSDLEYEFDQGNIESLLVDEIITLDSKTPKKYIIGVKQRGGNWQPFYFNPVLQTIKLKVIGG